MPKGRKANREPNTVFTGIIKRDNDGAAYIEVQYNDNEGNRRLQILLLKVDNGKLLASPIQAIA